MGEVLNIVVVLILIPAIPGAVAIDLMGIAGRLSALPGIREGGGISSGFGSLFYLIGLIGVVGLASSAVFAGTPYGPIDGQIVPEPTDRSTQVATPSTGSIPTSVPTATDASVKAPVGHSSPASRPTPTTEQSPAKIRRQELDAFEQLYTDLIDSTLRRPDKQDTYLLASKYVQNEEGDVILWTIYWECRNAKALNDQMSLLSIQYLIAADYHNGTMPDGLRVHGVSDFEALSGKIFDISTEDAKAFNSGEMGKETFEETWENTLQFRTEDQNETAYTIVAEERGEALANKAWHDDAEDPGGCPGPAEVHPTNARDDD